MRKILLSILLLAAMQFGSFAQEETLFSGEVHHGGFGGPALRFAKVADKFGVYVGGYGGWLINHQAVLGLGGYGLVTKMKPGDEVNKALNARGDLRLEFGYGGLYLEYIAQPDKLIHFSFSTLIGSGGINITEQDAPALFSDNSSHNSIKSTTIFVMEPGVQVELNITTFMRFTAGAGYLIVTGVDIPGLKNSDLSSPYASLSLKFGAF